jgi:hypothetical protein
MLTILPCRTDITKPEVAVTVATLAGFDERAAGDPPDELISHDRHRHHRSAGVK